MQTPQEGWTGQHFYDRLFKLNPRGEYVLLRAIKSTTRATEFGITGEQVNENYS